MSDPLDPNPAVRRLTRRVQDAALGERSAEPAWPEPVGRPQLPRRPAFKSDDGPRAAGGGCLVAAGVAVCLAALGVGGWFLVGRQSPDDPQVVAPTWPTDSAARPMPELPLAEPAVPVPKVAFPPTPAVTPPMAPIPPRPSIPEALPPRPTPPLPTGLSGPGEYAVANPGAEGSAGAAAAGSAASVVGIGGGASAATPGGGGVGGSGPGGGAPAAPAGSTTSAVSGGGSSRSVVPLVVVGGLLVCVVVGVLVVRRRRPTPPPGEPTVTFDPARTVTADPVRTLTQTPGRDGPDPGLMPVLDCYKLVRHLGEGAYGTVFLGIPADRPTERVAVKFFAYHSARWAHLQAEVKRLTDLHDLAGVVQLHEVAADADPPYFVMRYAEGGSLAGRLKYGPLPTVEAVRLARQLAAALAGVHARGIVHCDLKPGNILLDAAGEPLLADFGQAQMVGDDAPALGTLFYMPPEQADPEGRVPDPRWDVYALGAVLHAAVCGGPPHAADTVRSALHRTPDVPARLRAYRDHLRAAPPPAGHRDKCPPLAGVIDRCLACDPGERFPDAAAVRDALPSPPR